MECVSKAINVYTSSCQLSCKAYEGVMKGLGIPMKKDLVAMVIFNKVRNVYLGLW